MGEASLICCCERSRYAICQVPSRGVAWRAASLRREHRSCRVDGLEPLKEDDQ